MSEETVAIGRCRVRKATEKALLVRVLATRFEAWMPRKAVEAGDSLADGQEFDGVVMRRLWATKGAPRPSVPREGPVQIQKLPYIPPQSQGLRVRPRRHRSMKGRMG